MDTKTSLKRRLFKNLFKTSTCWLWNGTLTSCGYGQFTFQGTHYRAHRASWLVHFGEIPNKLFVLHKCNNPKCCNPAHLYLGTQRDNIAYASKCGRGFRGSLNNNSKLSDKDISEIRKLYNQGLSSYKLAEMYPVSRSAINYVVNNGWKHIDNNYSYKTNHIKGNNHRLSKLNKEIVIQIRQMHKEGISFAEMGRKFSVCANTIKQVVKGITWKHV